MNFPEHRLLIKRCTF